VRPVIAATVVAVCLVAGLLVFGSAGDGPESTTPGVIELGPFGPPLEAALAYMGTDRVLYLIDLATGERLGSKAVPADRRPAAVSQTHAYLGRLTAAPGTANWDSWRSLPWSGTMYHDVGPGNWLALWPDPDCVVAAGRPLPGGRNGVRITGADTLIESEGLWGALTPVGDRLLARELVGDREAWWLLAPGIDATRIALPDGFHPVAGGHGVAAGRSTAGPIVADLRSGAAATLQGPLGSAAAWNHDGSLLATVTPDPAELCAYRRDGVAEWCRKLQPPISPEWGGVSWSPDGSFLVLAEGGTLAAYRNDGERIGVLDTLQPTPQISAAWLQLLPRPVDSR
jgi:hypothetical protein